MGRYAGREVGAPRRQHMEAFHAHTQAERSQQGRGPGWGGGPGWLILSRAAGEGELIPRARRRPTPGVHRKDLSRKDAAKVSWEREQEGPRGPRGHAAGRPGAPRTRSAPVLSSPSACLAGLQDLSLPGALGSLRNHTPTFAGRRWELSDRKQSLAGVVRYLRKRPSGFQREDETEVSLPTHPDNRWQRGRKRERK